MAISQLAWTGLAREATAGTAMPTPTMFHPCKSKISRKQKKLYTDEDRGSRDTNNTSRKGTRRATVEIDGEWYNDSGVYIIGGFMGGLATSQPDATGNPTVYQQDLTLVDVPWSQTVFKNMDAARYILPYGVVEKVVFKYTTDGKLVSCTANYLAAYGVKDTGAAPSVTYSNYSPLAGWEPIVKFNSTASTDIEDMTITLEQKITPFFGGGGSADVTAMKFGARKATIDFTARFDNDTLYQRYDQGLLDAIEVDFTGDLISSTYFQNLKLTFPIVSYDEMDHDTSKDFVTVKAKATAQPGATLNSLFTGQVINTVTSYVS